VCDWHETPDTEEAVMKGPDGKYIFGTVKVGERGQIVIPKEARDVFDIKAGDTLLLLGDEAQGIAIVKNELFRQFAQDILGAQEQPEEDG
jgi:AbrB family looped-hinge helix DNA binding protein